MMDGMECTRLIRERQRPDAIRPYIIAQTANARSDGDGIRVLALVRPRGHGLGEQPLDSALQLLTHLSVVRVTVPLRSARAAPISPRAVCRAAWTATLPNRSAWSS